MHLRTLTTSPCGGHQALPECQERPWGVLRDMLSHGVLSLPMVWLGNLHLIKDCDAFVDFRVRDDPWGAFLLPSNVDSPPRQLAFQV